MNFDLYSFMYFSRFLSSRPMIYLKKFTRPTINLKFFIRNSYNLRTKTMKRTWSKRPKKLGKRSESRCSLMRRQNGFDHESFDDSNSSFCKSRVVFINVHAKKSSSLEIIIHFK